MQFEKHLTKFALASVAVMLALVFAINAFAQQPDPICKDNPQAPQCLINQQPAQAPRWGSQQLNYTPDQIDQQTRDYGAELQRQKEAQVHMCELQAQHDYQECVRRGNSSCPLKTCY